MRLHELKDDGIARKGPYLKLVPGGYRCAAVAREYLISPETHCFELLGRFPYILILYQAADSGAGRIVNIRALAATLVAGLIIYVFGINTRSKARCDSQEPICDSVSGICDKEAPDL
tara:strand:+ start:159 stop:509 length:351 start_codon:yes stop_codon:yes gene_type:complete